MKKIKLTYDQIDDIVLSELKEMLHRIMDDPWPMYHNLVESKRDVDAFLRVIEYISCDSDFKQYSQTLDFSKLGVDTPDVSGSVTIDEITENEDGSANIQFSTSRDQLNLLTGEGFKYLLMKGISGKTDDEIMNIIG